MSNDNYEVEKILESKYDKKRGEMFRVKWKGYPESESTWEPLRNLSTCKEVLKQYRRKQEKKSAPSKPAEPYPETVEEDPDQAISSEVGESKEDIEITEMYFDKEEHLYYTLKEKGRQYRMSRKEVIEKKEYMKALISFYEKKMIFIPTEQ